MPIYPFNWQLTLNWAVAQKTTKKMIHNWYQCRGINKYFTSRSRVLLNTDIGTDTWYWYQCIPWCHWKCHCFRCRTLSRRANVNYENDNQSQSSTLFSDLFICREDGDSSPMMQQQSSNWLNMKKSLVGSAQRVYNQGIEEKLHPLPFTERDIKSQPELFLQDTMQ